MELSISPYKIKHLEILLYKEDFKGKMKLLFYFNSLDEREKNRGNKKLSPLYLQIKGIIYRYELMGVIDYNDIR